jgi:hypothetical protein
MILNDVKEIIEFFEKYNKKYSISLLGNFNKLDIPIIQLIGITKIWVPPNSNLIKIHSTKKD